MMKTIRKLILVALTLTAAFVAGADTVLAFVPCAETAQTSNSIPTDVSSPADGDFTWEAWFKPSKLDSAENRMVAQTGWAWNDTGRLMLAVRKHKNNPAPGEPAIEAFYYNGGNKRLIGSTVVTEGWHHAALVRSGTTISLYLDGVFETNATDYVNATPSGASTAPFLIGPAFYGSLAEVRLWNVARTAAEIAASKDTRLAGTEPNLLGYWPLDEGGTPVEPVNKVTGVAATNVTIDVAGVSRTVGYNQGEGLGTAAYEDDTGLALTPVPAAGTVYTTTAAGGKWSEIAWTPSTPVSGTGARIVLAGAGAFENDLGTFSLNALTFSATASLSGDGLVFAAEGGANPTLATTGAATNDVNVAMRLDAPLTWTGDNTAGSMRLNGALSGTGDLIHDPTAIDIIDYINGDNSAWSGNIDQRLSFIVISNSVNLGTGTYYCTNETCRVRGRDTLRIYGNNTITNRFYLGSEGGGGAGARVDIFGVTTFTEPFGVYSTRVGILDVTTFEGGIYNWSGNGGNNAVFQSGTGNAAKGVVHINGPLNIRGVLYCNALETSNNKLKIFLHSPTNVFAGFLGIHGGVLSMGGEGCYPTNAYFGGQTMTYSGSFLGGVLDLNGYSQVLGYHVGYADSLTNSSFKIRNSVAATVPTVRVMQTADNLTSPLVTEGPMHFIKDGAKLLAITNSFGVGGTLEVAAGTLRLTAPSEGRLADTVIVREGAMLDLGGNTFACGLLVLNGGTVYNGTLAVDEAGLGDGTVSAALVGADIAVTGAVAYAAAVSAAKTLSTNGLVFYMPFDDPATYLTDEGPDKVVLSCQKTNKHGTLGTATYVTADVRYGAGCLHLDGKSPLVPVDGVFPGHVPTGAAPYTVAFCYKIESGATISLGLLGYGAQSVGQGNNFQFPRLTGYEDFSVVNNYYWIELSQRSRVIQKL
ncbi:MAG: LamG domain-containing protein [Kiritimatiellae bacterium]|nr:LamG domain-containing protein [Kiritimatiellia bacterium]